MKYLKVSVDEIRTVKGGVNRYVIIGSDPDMTKNVVINVGEKTAKMVKDTLAMTDGEISEEDKKDAEHVIRLYDQQQKDGKQKTRMDMAKPN